jgi:pyruvyl transferase EpsO
MNDLNNPQLQTPQDIKKYLHDALNNIPDFKNCALLDYPSYSNIGDHLIWLGSLLYITQHRKAKIDYASSIGDGFSESQFSNCSKEGPILLNGGGNFGDIWPAFQQFRERIIQQYKDRPIVILPQTIYYSSEEALEQSAKILNEHPDLTIFVRDDRSFAIAQQAFFNCKVYKAPDMAFQMVDLPKMDINPSRSEQILYLCRKDVEMNYNFKPKNIPIENLDVDDWISFNWMSKVPKNWIYIPGLVRLIREGWQRGLKTPQEWASRQEWQWLHPDSSVFNQVHRPELHRKSWGYMHSGIYQLQGYNVVITNRLHVHILCLILNIPHIILPGSYYKIPAFYNTWTSQIPWCRLVDNVDEIPNILKELTT